MKKLAEVFQENYDAITAKTKGASPANQILWTSTILTIFQLIETWVEQHQNAK